MTNDNIPQEERRLLILKGIGQDRTSVEIAAEMGVRIWMVLNDLRTMKYNKDPELKQAYLDKETRANANKQSQIMDERFHNMTGMTIQEKNFENTINYYKMELQRIYESQDEFTTIMGLPSVVRNMLRRNEILTWHSRKMRISAKARDYLLLKFARASSTWGSEI
jgi:hypothetical protein